LILIFIKIGKLNYLVGVLLGYEVHNIYKLSKSFKSVTKEIKLYQKLYIFFSGNGQYKFFKLMEIVILRLGHRPERDKRISTHVGLVGRALGAKGMLLASSDKGIASSINEVTQRWGGDFFVQTGVKWSDELKRWKQEGGKVCHLTMYGSAAFRSSCFGAVSRSFATRQRAKN
jgi:hypothetical protein